MPLDIADLLDHTPCAICGHTAWELLPGEYTMSVNLFKSSESDDGIALCLAYRCRECHHLNLFLPGPVPR